MVTIGIFLLIVGVVVVIVCAVAPVPAPIGTLGWIALGIGVLLIVLGLVLPYLPAVHNTAAVHGMVAAAL